MCIMLKVHESNRPLSMEIIFIKIPDLFSLLLAHLIKLNSFLASDDFCHLLITFANSLDPDQDRQNVGPDLDPNCLTL